MKSLSVEQNDVSVGMQRPRLSLVPESVYNDAWQDATELAEKYGTTLDEWQQNVLKGWLGERGNGTWSCSLCGLSVPRQNGKGAVLEARELYGLLILGERILHTAHELKTAKDHFRRMKTYFEREDLSKRVTRIVNTNGEEAIWLDNGGVIRFAARSKNSGRGFSADLLVCDEAQELSDDEFEALSPVLATSPNPQRILTGTPPSPTMNGEVFGRVRNQGMEGQAERLSWLEWSADKNDALDDFITWAKANPALGYRLSIEKIQDERSAMSEDGFARERLGMWQTASSNSVFDLELWSELAADVDVEDPVVFAIDVSPLRDRASIGLAGYVGDKVMVQVAESKKGTAWVVDLMARMNEVWKPIAVVIDKKSPAATLIAELKRKRVKVIETDGADMAKACGDLFDRVQNETLLHGNQAHLNTAIASARTRPIGDAFGWNRKSVDTDITPLVAVTLAAYGLTTRRKPKSERMNGSNENTRPPQRVVVMR